MVVSFLAASASAWGVLMGLSPVLQIRRMLRQQSSREVSLGYFAILLAGFVLWISYGIAAGNMWLVVPNSIALLVGLTLVPWPRLRRRCLGANRYASWRRQHRHPCVPAR